MRTETACCESCARSSRTNYFTELAVFCRESFLESRVLNVQIQRFRAFPEQVSPRILWLESANKYISLTVWTLVVNILILLFVVIALNTCKEGCDVYSLFNDFSSGLIYYRISHETRVCLLRKYNWPVLYSMVNHLVSIAEGNKDKRPDGSGIK